MTDSIHKLAELFLKFPGIGARQAQRFVYFLLTQDQGYVSELTAAIQELREAIHTCAHCQRFFIPRHDEKLCIICSDKNRDPKKLLIVEKDVDLENVERTSTFDGNYFVLGGIVPILEKEPQRKVRIKALLKRVEDESKNGLKEIILALSASPEGEHTADYCTQQLSSAAKEHNIKISKLGRGLSTGLEIEYSDSETIKNALKNRA